MQLVELFSGIGAAGVAAAGLAEVVAAYDQNPQANVAYAHNTGRQPSPKNLAALRGADLRPFAACAWWMSPPCQPYTRRGLGKDADDPRSAALGRLVGIVAELRPPVVMVENVPGFRVSTMRARLLSALADYHLAEVELCPTALGVPMRRRRYYLVASRAGAPVVELPAANARSLANYLDPPGCREVEYLDEGRVRASGHSAHVVAASGPDGVATCFTSAYGRSPVHAGSYVDDGRGVRRFSPAEILRLLGFSPRWSFPSTIPRPQQYALVGNSLSVDVARSVIRAGLCAGRLGAS